MYVHLHISQEHVGYFVMTKEYLSSVELLKARNQQYYDLDPAVHCNIFMKSIGATNQTSSYISYPKIE